MQIGIAILPFVAVLVNAYGKRLLNKCASGGKGSNVELEEDKIKAKFLWTVRKVSLDKIGSIVGYSDDDFGRDTINEFVVVRFGWKNDIVFNAADNAHVALLDKLMLRLNARSIDWSKGFAEGTEDKPVMIYKRPVEYRHSVK